MNIFYLDPDPEVAARQLCDRHLKMLLESGQMMSTAHHVAGSWHEALFRPTHRSHPCTVWVRSSIDHYRWTARNALEICREYTRRYGRQHAREATIRWLLTHEPSLPAAGFTEPPQAMPEHCRVDGDAVAAYRQYYIVEKSHFAVWRHSETPSWYVAGDLRTRS